MKRFRFGKRAFFVVLPVLLLGAIRGEGGRRRTEAASPAVSDVHWVVPSSGLPAEVTLLPANNNVAIERFDGRLHMAWRSAPTHFASASAKLFVTSSADEGRTWRMENEIARGTDVREPHFVVMNGTLLSISWSSARAPWRSSRSRPSAPRSAPVSPGPVSSPRSSRSG